MNCRKYYKNVTLQTVGMELVDEENKFSLANERSNHFPISCIDDTELLVSLRDESVSATGIACCTDTLLRCDADKCEIENILDKRISIDDDNLLITPLQPIKLSFKVDAKFSNIEQRSVLKTSKNECGAKNVRIKKVSFPTDTDELVSYKEADVIDPFIIQQTFSPEEMAVTYENSCEKNNTMEIKCIKTQLNNIKNNNDRSANLKLSKLHITYEVLETLEDIFKVVNFRIISLVDCTLCAGSVAMFFDMLEYYDCTSNLILSVDLEQLEAWKLFCHFLTKIVHLESITLKSMNVNDVNIKNLMNSINANRIIRSVTFDNCTLVKLPNFTLIEYLESNETINELRLLQVGLYTREADIIGRLLRKNDYIQILDISNNLIGDRGLEHLAKGLCQQKEDCHNGRGLSVSVLIVFNNQISEKSGKTINNIINKCRSLRTLNVGFNHLTDSVISDIADSLKASQTLEGLGLQATVLTCKGVTVLAEIIKENKSLKKINLRGNKAVFIDGLEELSEALTLSNISTVELDDTNRSCADTEGYSAVVKKIRQICTINRSLVDQSSDEEKYDAQCSRNDIFSGKIFLNCEPYYNTSFVSAPAQHVSTHTQSQLFPVSDRPFAAKSRFSVSKVIDSVYTCKPVENSSRFKVVGVSNVDLKNYNVTNTSIVEEEDNAEDDDDDDGGSGGQFQNIRGSVSSIDSVDCIDCADSS